MKTNTDNIWNLRDEIIEAHIEAAGISDVLTRYEKRYELHEQADLLAELAEAIEEEVAEWWDIDTAKLDNLLAATIELDNTYRARNNATREFTRHCMEENIVYFGKQVMQYA